MIRITSAGEAPQFDRHATVLYDRESGRIVHVHYVLSRKGFPLPSLTAIEGTAREHGVRLGFDMERLDLLHVPGEREPGAYRVDPSARELVAFTPPSRTRRSRAG